MSITEQFFNKNAKTQQLSRSAKNFCDRSKLDFLPKKSAKFYIIFYAWVKRWLQLK